MFAEVMDGGVPLTVRVKDQVPVSPRASRTVPLTVTVPGVVTDVGTVAAPEEETVTSEEETVVVQVSEPPPVGSLVAVSWPE